MFYLYVDGRREPRVPHLTFESAKVEANRLALKERRMVSIYRLVDRVEPAAREGADDAMV